MEIRNATKNSTGARFRMLLHRGWSAQKDKDGYFWIMGRVDDVINVSGHRLGTMEIESALVSHPAVAEAAVVGKPDEVKGTAISAFVTLEARHSPSDKLKEELRQHVIRRDRSEHWPGRMRSDLPTISPRPGAGRLCGDYCEISPPEATRSETPQRWKTTRS